MDGRYQTFHEDGSVNISGFYENGQKQGKWLVYGRNGVIIQEDNYVKGLRTGASKSWYLNGKPESYAEYRMGSLNGKKILYDKYGNKIYEAVYKNNILQKVLFKKETQTYNGY